MNTSKDAYFLNSHIENGPELSGEQYEKEGGDHMLEPCVILVSTPKHVRIHPLLGNGHFSPFKQGNLFCERSEHFPSSIYLVISFTFGRVTS